MNKRCVALLLAGLVTCSAPASIQPTRLQCEGQADPLGVDAEQPVLSWWLKSSDAAARGLRQTACQVLAASSADRLARGQGDLWDSGKLATADSTRLVYGGAALRPSQPVFWKVRAWDEAGHASDWSEAATWTMGLLRESDWGARWISSAGLAHVPRKARGYHAGETAKQDDMKWVQVDLGAPRALDAVRLCAMQHAGHDGFGFPLRFRIEAGDAADFSKSAAIADHSAADFQNPGYRAVDFPAAGVTARYVRVTAIRLQPHPTQPAHFAFALEQFEVMARGTNIAVGCAVSARDSVENFGWGQASLTDGQRGEQKSDAAALLRRSLPVKAGLRRALIHVCGLGQYELFVNGRKVGDQLLSPGWTRYDRTCLYDTFDLTDLLRPGQENALGLALGNGMYNVTGGRYTKFTGSFGPPKAIAHLRLEYADGTVETVGTDERWRTDPGPVTFSCIFGGEDFDARREPRGWAAPGYDDAGWPHALAVAGPGGALRGASFAGPPLRAIETLQPVATNALDEAAAVYDLGQNAPFMPRLKVKGRAGQQVRITPAELLGPKGAVDRGSCGGGAAYWQYTLRGDPAGETWFPQFFYQGCRYLQVERRPAEGEAERPAVEQLEGVVVHTSARPAGEFSCSNDLFNRVRTLTRWAQRANLVSVISDCPHRERLGWLEQYHLHYPSLSYEFDLARLYGKCLTDMADAQRDNGLVPDIAPEYVRFNGGFVDSPEWGSSFVIVPWQQFEWTGDDTPLRNHYDAMGRYVAYLGTKAKDHIVSHGLGDWYDIGPRSPGYAQLTPIPLTATAYYYYDTWIMAQTAQHLGRADDARRYTEQAAAIRAAFNAAFFNASNGCYAAGSQAAQAIPLVMGLVEPAQRDRVFAALVADVQGRGHAVTAGDIGHRYLLRALADGGRSDLIFAMHSQTNHPGYAMQLARGATSLTEAWDAGRGSSQNHFMLGHIMEWFYADLAGLAPDPAAPGYANIIVRPQPVGDIAWAGARFDSPRGPVAVSWERGAAGLRLSVVIPPNATATVFVPAAAGGEIREGAQPAEQAPGVKLLRREPGAAVYSVGSGRYVFSAAMK